MQITRIEDISIAWLNQIAYYIKPEYVGAVSSFQVENVGIDMGFVNQLVRVLIEYESGIAKGPKSVIVKCPPLDLDLKRVSNRLNNLQREIRIYQGFDLPDGITIPRLYYSSIEESYGNGVLVIEDIDYAIQGDSVVGCSYQEAVLAIKEIAKFHAHYWIRSNRESFNSIPHKSDEIFAYQELFRDAWESLVQKAGIHMPLYLLGLGDKLAGNINKIKTILSGDPITLIHGDYRLDNCFFVYEHGPQPDGLKVIDWEYCVKGRGVNDVAAFISEAFRPNDRRDLEWKLLAIYYSTLKHNGVTDYSFDQCFEDYRISMLEILIFWVISGGFCDYSGTRATEYLSNSLDRFSQAVIDLRCEEFLT